MDTEVTARSEATDPYFTTDTHSTLGLGSYIIQALNTHRATQQQRQFMLQSQSYSNIICTYPNGEALEIACSWKS
jgi:hypothetical protein